MGCSDIEVWCKTVAIGALLIGGIALIIPAGLVIRSYNIDYITTRCSSNITNTIVKNTIFGTWYASADTFEPATGYRIRLVFPAFPGRQALVAVSETAANAWVSRISAGSPTATFTCLVVEQPQPGKTVTGISSRQADRLIGWIIAMICSVLCFTVLVAIFCYLCDGCCCAAKSPHYTAPSTIRKSAGNPIPMHTFSDA